MSRKKRKPFAFKHGIKEFLRYCRSEKGLSEKTLSAYMSDLAWFAMCLRRTTRADLANLGKSEVLTLVEKLKDSFKPRSARRKLAVLKSFMRYHEREGAVAASPFNSMQIRIRPPETMPRSMKSETAHMLVKTAELQAERDDIHQTAQAACIINLLMFTGIRVSELVGLNMGDINPDENEVIVMGKGSRERIVPIVDSRSILTIRRFIAARSRCFPNRKGIQEPLLLGKNGQRVTDQAIRSMVLSLGVKAGAEERVTPHMFRHTFASLLSGAGVDIRAIQQLLGHKSILTTQIYAHVSKDDQKALLKKAGLRRRIKNHR